MADEVQQAEGQQDEQQKVEDQFAEADAKGDPNPEPLSIEELASEQGWVPKDKFKGSEDDWKPAHEFIRAGKDIQKGLKRDLDGVRNTLDTVSKTSAALLAERLAEQRAQLSADFQRANEEGDPDKAWRAANGIMRIDATPLPGQGRPTPPAEAADWAQKNQRIINDPRAAQRAVDLCEPYARANWTAAQQLQAIEPALRQEFPYLFEGMDKGPAGVSAPGSRMNGTQKRGKTAADLPKEARAVAEDYVDRGLIKDVDQYARNYFAVQAKGN
jgi:hypothetical protein